MPLVNVMVNARAYTIACDEGEEAHLKELAAHVDEKVRELTGSVGQVGDQKLILMAAVLITDEFFEARGRVHGHATKAKELASAHADLDARAAEAEKRAARAVEAAEAHAAEVEKQAADAIKDAEKRSAQALSDAERRIAELEALAAQAAHDAQARVNEMRQDAEAQIAEAKREAEERAASTSLESQVSELEAVANKYDIRIEELEARLAAATAEAQAMSARAEEADARGALELDEVASRVERIVEKLKAA
ncbi:MAG TPA: cell division protein ZapA [Rhizomicrobium sp.]|nr:cell division protein ZapA [Rhizomicrobium sp.]